MNKKELIDAIAEKANVSKKEAGEVLDATLDVIKEAVAKDDKVQLIGFGTFSVKTRGERVARNPRTGENIKVEACKRPVFTASAPMKKAVN